jgi:hypothetical protein
VRALAVSDLHFGAWTCDPVLARPFALARLEPQLEDLDELILLGDVFDFLFSSVEHAFAEADPFFELVRRKMQGKRMVFLAGNHDHHIVVRTLRSLIETKIATGAEGDELQRAFAMEYRSFFQRFLDRRLPGVETELVYPSYRFGDVHLCHGHYLDAHMEGSLPNRVLTRAVWTIAGGRPEGDLREEDYEAVVVPLTQLLFTVAQMPRGCAAQMSFHHHFERVGQVLHLGALAQAGLKRATCKITGRANGTVLARHRKGRSLARACDPSDPPSVALGAYCRVLRELGWDGSTDKVVFSHTHQPLAGAVDPGCPDLRFWNTGSWIYEPSVGSLDAYTNYLRHAWPGTAVLIDTERPEPELIEMLADQNPLNGGSPRPGEILRAEPDEVRGRAAGYDARLRRLPSADAASV